MLRRVVNFTTGQSDDFTWLRCINSVQYLVDYTFNKLNLDVQKY